MRKKQPHKVWRVRVGSFGDEKLANRRVMHGKRYVDLFKLPCRAEYLIEAKGQGAVATKKALKLASDDGINRPVVLSIDWHNCPHVKRD